MLLATGEISSVELTQAALERITQVDGQVRAYLTVTAEQALEQAGEADRRRKQGETSPLLGVPVAVKDVICVPGAPTTCGSKILENFVPPFAATVVEKLCAAGAVITGKTNTDEFAMGSSTENSAYWTTRNPWDLDRVPGGSSGGSAAAVTAQMVPLALGSDTGGSVRQPASFCGIVGVKPSYGRVSRYGLVAFASSLDQIGTLGRDVRDAALMLQAIAGHDARDSTSMPVDVPDYTAALVPDLKGTRVGVPQEYFVEGLQPEIEAAMRVAIGRLAQLGAEIVEIRLPHTPYALPTYYLIAPAECSANLARYDGIRYGMSAQDAEDIWDVYRLTRGRGLGAEVKRRIMLGTYALSTGYYDQFYLKAQRVRTLIKRDFDLAFQGGADAPPVDVIVGPTTPTTAFKIGEKADDPLQMYLSDVFTLSANLAGICGLSLPCGLVDGLPVGLQIQGPAFGEEKILRVAYAYEQATEWHTIGPQVG